MFYIGSMTTRTYAAQQCLHSTITAGPKVLYTVTVSTADGDLIRPASPRASRASNGPMISPAPVTAATRTDRGSSHLLLGVTVISSPTDVHAPSTSPASRPIYGRLYTLLHVYQQSNNWARSVFPNLNMTNCARRILLMESMVIATFYQSLLTFIKILHNLTHHVLT